MRSWLRRSRWLPLCGLVLCLGAQAARLPAGKPEVRSSAVLVMDESDSSVLYSRHANRVVPIASITKLMTALVALDSGQSLDEKVRISPLDRDLRHGSGSRLTVGTELTRGQLLQIALMSSDNRAAHAIGRTHPEGMEAFVK